VPYETHPVFETPPDETPIWRYMDLPKFVSVLSTSSLFFVRADRLDDPFEGSLPRATREDFAEWLRQQRFDDGAATPDQVLGTFMRHLQQMRRYTLINSWIQGANESDGMWRLYGGSQGVAIRTTIGALKDALRCDVGVYIGRVKYVDYDTAVIPLGNTFWPYTHKRLGFRHEEEVRAVAVVTPPAIDGVFDYSTDICEVGQSVQVELQSLIEAVAVPPFAPGWFRDAVQDLVNRYGLDIQVRQSDLGRLPEW
jgi:hypothetical protein